jgi:uracil-DNA glycosylase family 4
MARSGGDGGGERDSLELLRSDIVECRACPRLVEWRERVAEEKRAAFADDEYWGRPVPGFGDPAASIVVVGLAPAAHGANRTGRMFTGDRSGDFLYSALHRAGMANQSASVSLDDGMVLSGVYITAPVRCAPPANKPTVAERERCLPFLRRELELLGHLEVLIALGQFAYQVVAGELGIKPRPRFSHGLEVSSPGGVQVLCSYHVSQQNTFTGKLTPEMFDEILARAGSLASSAKM